MNKLRIKSEYCYNEIKVVAQEISDISYFLDKNPGIYDLFMINYLIIRIHGLFEITIKFYLSLIFKKSKISQYFTDRFEKMPLYCKKTDINDELKKFGFEKIDFDKYDKTIPTNVIEQKLASLKDLRNSFAHGIHVHVSIDECKEYFECIILTIIELEATTKYRKKETECVNEIIFPFVFPEANGIPSNPARSKIIASDFLIDETCTNSK